MQPGANRPDSASEGSGGVVVADVLQIAEDDHFTILPRQRQDRATQALQ